MVQGLVLFFWIISRNITYFNHVINFDSSNILLSLGKCKLLPLSRLLHIDFPSSGFKHADSCLLAPYFFLSLFISVSPKYWLIFSAAISLPAYIHEENHGQSCWKYLVPKIEQTLMLLVRRYFLVVGNWWIGN